MKTGAKADPAAVDAVVPWKALSTMKGTETLEEYIVDAKDEFSHEIVPASKPYLTSKHVKSVAGLKTAKYCKKCCRHATLSSRSTWGGAVCTTVWTDMKITMRTRLAKGWKQGRQKFAKIKDSDLAHMTSVELMAAYDT